MVEFFFKGIRVSALEKMERCIYKDAGGRSRTRFDREVIVSVRFWDFILMEGDLQELAFVKATLSYFMQAYWKRSSKQGSRIELEKGLRRLEDDGNDEELCFKARQKDKRNYLHLAHVKNGVNLDEVFLDGQEVIILDIAIQKAINLLNPHQADELTSRFQGVAR